MNDVRASLANQGLIRPRDGRILGGVCAGSGAGSGSRRGSRGCCSCSLLMVVPGSQLLIYPVLWILMPAEETATYQAPATS